MPRCAGRAAGRGDLQHPPGPVTFHEVRRRRSGSMSPRPTSTRPRRGCVTGRRSLAHSRRWSHPARSPTSAPAAEPRSPRSRPDFCAGHCSWAPALHVAPEPGGRVQRLKYPPGSTPPPGSPHPRRSGSEHQSRCGSAVPVATVVGRMNDLLRFTGPDGAGVDIPPLALGSVIEEAAGVRRRFQAVQTGPATVTVRVEVAPPRTAPTQPATPSATSTTATHAGTRQAGGGSRIANRGSTAPRVKGSAEAPAACQGLVRSPGTEAIRIPWIGRRCRRRPGGRR